MGRKYRGKRPKIRLQKRGLILCEGETEEYFFKGIITNRKRRRNLSSIDVDIYKPRNHSPKGLINEAKKS